MRGTYRCILFWICVWLIIGCLPWIIEISPSEKIVCENEDFMGPRLTEAENNTSLSVQFINPEDGAHLRGKCEVKISVNSSSEITRVEWYLDGNILNVFYNNTTEWVWDTTTIRECSHTLRVRIGNANNEQSSAEINVWVDNTAPFVQIQYISFGEYYNGSKRETKVVRMEISVVMVDNIDVLPGVYLLIDGNEKIGPPLDISRIWGGYGKITIYITTPDGVHNFTLVCYDLAGNTNSSTYEAFINRNEIYMEPQKDYSPYYLPLSIITNFILVLVLIWLIVKHRKTKEMLEIEHAIHNKEKRN
ncbi:MAG: Ig-like domain-containing protein [Thermoplasmata archaeon]